MTLGWLDALALALFVLVLAVNLGAGWSRRAGARGPGEPVARPSRRSGWLHR